MSYQIPNSVASANEAEHQEPRHAQLKKEKMYEKKSRLVRKTREKFMHELPSPFLFFQKERVRVTSMTFHSSHFQILCLGKWLTFFHGFPSLSSYILLCLQSCSLWATQLSLMRSRTAVMMMMTSAGKQRICSDTKSWKKA